MKFMVKWNIDQDKWIPVLKAFSSMTPAQRADDGTGVTVVGRWHDMSTRTGVAILESPDTASVARHLNRWNSMCNIDIAPVLNDDEAAALSRTILADVSG